MRVVGLWVWVCVEMCPKYKSKKRVLCTRWDYGCLCWDGRREAASGVCLLSRAPFRMCCESMLRSSVRPCGLHLSASRINSLRPEECSTSSLRLASVRGGVFCVLTIQAYSCGGAAIAKRKQGLGFLNPQSRPDGLRGSMLKPHFRIHRHSDCKPQATIRRDGLLL